MIEAHRQASAGIRFDWALPGALAVAPDADVAVLVDVLSFTTTLTVALDAGVTVLPFPWGDPEAAERCAREHDAVLAAGRSAARPGQISLSPASVRRLDPPARLVLPSPNGSTIAHELAAAATACLGACLRNARAVAAWICDRYPPDAAVAVIAAGERWADGSLRPAVEDLWGAGAVIDALADCGERVLSPEAAAARAAYRAVSAHTHEALRACASGRELIDAGFATDVAIAAEMNDSVSVPRLTGGIFVPAP